MATTEEKTKVKAEVPEDERPNLNDGEVSFGDDLGEEPELDLDTYPDATPEAPLGYLPNGNPRKRRKRGTATPRATGTISVPRGKNALRIKAASGASILYGGIGVVLAGSGLFPAAGMSMQGLADEAGEPIALWAEKRSPRFFQFLSTLSDAAGIGKYVAAPMAAEGYVRVPPARPALGPLVEFAHGPEGKQAFDEMSRQHDEYVMQQAFDDQPGDDEVAA